MWAGAWRLAEGARGDDEVDEVLADRGVQRLRPVRSRRSTPASTCTAGIGLDVTYPLHRYFAWAKHYAHLLGGAEAQLDTIGDLP